MSHRLGAVAIVALLAMATGVPASTALFRSSDTSSAALSTGSVAPPTNLAASVSGTSVTLTWTPTVTAGAGGYSVLRSATSGSGYATVGSVSPASTATASDAPGNGAWFYVLRTVLASWTSVPSNEVLASVGSLTTGFQPCTQNAPVTSGSGDNDGYETSPGDGCVADGALALDTSTGTDTVVSCTDPGKDRHEFWGYAFGLPASVSSVDGIEVSLTAGLSNQGGTSMLCVELSWDGGATWTSPQSVSMAGSAVTSYAFGASTDTWGHAWTLAQLTPTAFRIRVTDVTSHPNKEFRLDGATAQVDYTP